MKNGFIVFGFGLFFLVACDQFSQYHSKFELPIEGSDLSLEQVEDAYTLAYDTQFEDDFVIGLDFEYKGEPTGRSYTLRVHKKDEVWLKVLGTRDETESYVILDRPFSSLEAAFRIGESLAKLSMHDYEEQREEQKILEKMTERELAEHLGIVETKSASRSSSGSRTSSSSSSRTSSSSSSGSSSVFSSSSSSRARSRARRTPEEQKAIASLQQHLKEYETLVQEANNPQPFKVEILAEEDQGIGIPWGMVFLPNGKELLWTERDGDIKKIYLPTGEITEITGGPSVYAVGQGGLFDVALHPDFDGEDNKYIYFTYSFQASERIDGERVNSTGLARGELDGDRIIGIKTLFEAQPFLPSNIKFGSRLVFDGGYLFMTVGDRGEGDKLWESFALSRSNPLITEQEYQNKLIDSAAQKLDNHLGKLLRFDDDDFDDLRAGQHAQPEIWSYGHKNAQGLFIHPDTGELYLQEHGPLGGDEINLIEKGANYGWPIYTHGIGYNGQSNMGLGTGPDDLPDNLPAALLDKLPTTVQPLKHWTPYFHPSIAPCGLLIYSGKKFPEWEGSFFSGALAQRHLNRLEIEDGIEERLLSSFNFRVRNVIEGPQGFIYISVDRGMILRISPL